MGGACHGVHVEIRRELAGVISLFLPCEPEYQTLVTRFSGNTFIPEACCELSTRVFNQFP